MILNLDRGYNENNNDDNDNDNDNNDNDNDNDNDNNDNDKLITNRRSVELAHSLGYKAVKTEATGLYSRSLHIGPLKSNSFFILRKPTLGLLESST